ncbi:MAG: J domain-containing protein [Polyangiales bacterium]
MDPVRGAAPLARLLLAVSVARRDQELWLEQRGRVVRLALRAGRLCALEGVPLTPLGDLLRELEALDCARATAMREGATNVPIGVRLIAAGATSWSSVQRALALQRARALELLLRMPVTRVWRTHATRVDAAVESDLALAVWDAMRTLATRLPERQRAELACSGRELVLTAAGRRRAEPYRHALRDDEPLRAVMVALGFAAPMVQREDSYALLLRKRHELARNAGPRALLDLPYDADARGAQRALRKLAGKLHPDRFVADDARLHRVSHEVMGALTRAASTFVA